MIQANSQPSAPLKSAVAKAVKPLARNKDRVGNCNLWLRFNHVSTWAMRSICLRSLRRNRVPRKKPPTKSGERIA